MRRRDEQAAGVSGALFRASARTLRRGGVLAVLISTAGAPASVGELIGHARTAGLGHAQHVE
jgi:uncharacterized protein YidB (DUF937 family)